MGAALNDLRPVLARSDLHGRNHPDGAIANLPPTGNRQASVFCPCAGSSGSKRVARPLPQILDEPQSLYRACAAALANQARGEDVEVHEPGHKVAQFRLLVLADAGSSISPRFGFWQQRPKTDCRKRQQQG